MKKRLLKRIIAAALCFLTVFSASAILPLPGSTAEIAEAVSPYTGLSITRFAGATRVDTANVIAENFITDGINTGKKSTTVFIANGWNYADALSCVPLAYKMNAPILLTTGTSLEAATKTKLTSWKSNGITNVIIIGGPVAVSDSVKTSIEKLGLKTERIHGNDRYLTCVAIANKYKDVAGNPKNVYVVTGADFPDALSAASIAALDDSIIMFSDVKSGLPTDEINWLKNTQPSASIIVGGTSVVPIAAETQLAGVTKQRVIRRCGNDRYSTNKELLAFDTGMYDSARNSTTFNACVAVGDNYPDALAGAVYAAKKGYPFILSSNNNGGNELWLACDRFCGSSYADSAAYNLVVFGGEGALNNESLGVSTRKLSTDPKYMKLFFTSKPMTIYSQATTSSTAVITLPANTPVWRYTKGKPASGWNYVRYYLGAIFVENKPIDKFGYIQTSGLNEHADKTFTFDSGMTTSAKNKANAELSKIPQAMWDAFVADGWKVHYTKYSNVYDYYGETISASSDLKSAAGITSSTHKTILVNYRENRVELATQHEFGHYIDHYCTYTPNRFPHEQTEFLTAYKAERSSMKIESPLVTESHIRNYEDEFFAEAFHNYLDHDKDLKAKAPKTYAYIQIVFNSFPTTLMF